MRPLLLALLGSPRPRGSCAQLLSAFCRDLRGWQILRVPLTALQLLPCQGCDKYRRTDICRKTEDMRQLIAWFDDAQALILAAPVYFYGLPAPVKAMVDCCHPLWHRRRWKTRAKRPAFFLSTCGAPRRSEFEVIRRESRAFLNTIGFQVAGEMLLPGLEKSDRSQRLARAKLRARGLGKRFARSFTYE